MIPRVMPEPDGSPACDELIQSCFPVAERKEIFLPSEFDAVLQRREEILQLSEKLEMERKKHRAEDRVRKFSKVSHSRRFVVKATYRLKMDN